MKWANDRAQALALLRSHAAKLVAEGVAPVNVMWQIISDIHAVHQEFMIEHDIPGARYWYIQESEDYWATHPGEASPLESNDAMAQLAMELTRAEFLGRQQIYLGIGNNLI